MNITVANAGSSVTPGVHLYCYGPYAAPADARSLLRFQPVVNMRLVHHLILYAGAGTPPGQASLSRPSPACYAGSIIYAWARTGQKTPLGLDLSGPDSPVAGAGFAVGPGTQVSWFAVQLHYQNMESASVHDTSGVQLAFSRQQPVAPLRLDVLMSTSIRIPPRVFQDECVTCRVSRGGTVIGYRNHGHRLARDFWTQPFDLQGAPQPPIGRLSAQEPQILRFLPAARELSAGQAIELHCNFDAKDVETATGLGLDERTQEMCNQYFLSTSALRVDCARDRPAPAHGATSALAAAVAAYAASTGGTALGQVTGLAADRRHLWLIHRGPTDFYNRAKLGFGPIVQLDRRDMSFVRHIGAGVFTVPHGLSVDHEGHLWATDVGSHQAFKLDATSGKVILTLGDGRAAAGATSFNKPTDVAVDSSSGNVFVADGYGNSRVAVFSSGGKFLREWGSLGSAEGQFRVPHGIAIDARGLVYVADRENARVQVFDQRGAFQSAWNSRVGSESPSGAPFTRHVSSVSYDAELDVFAVSEGGAVVLRSASGCQLLQQPGWEWPHDAVVFPPLEPFGTWRTASAAWSVVGAELLGKTARVFEVRLGGGVAATSKSVYG